jgi:hypothetical protein
MPLLRDAHTNYKPLEKHHSTLTEGMSFGEPIFSSEYEKNKASTWNLCAMTDVLFVTLKKTCIDDT